jgi:hypothetical protein
MSGGRRLSAAADFERDVIRRLAAHENGQGCATQNCTAFPNAAKLFGTGTACAAEMMASSSASCYTNTLNSLVYSCMSQNVALYCPANNNDPTTVPYLKNTTQFKCQACRLTVSSDLDPNAGTFRVNLVFGNNYHRDSGAYSEANIAGYKVYLVAQDGILAGRASFADVTASGQPTSCCNEDAYVATVVGSWSSSIENGAGGYFEIVPYTMIGNEKVDMPLGTMTGKVSDVSTGTAVKVEQRVNLVMSEAHATAMATDSSYDPVIIKAIVAALNDSRYLDEYFSIISKIAQAVAGGRRLDSNGRGLVAHATYELKVNYEALLPSSVPVITDTAINTTKLLEAVNTESAKAGIPVTVASATAEAVTTTNVGTGSTPTDGAHRVAGSIFASFAAMLLVLTGQLSFA